MSHNYSDLRQSAEQILRKELAKAVDGHKRPHLSKNARAAAEVLKACAEFDLTDAVKANTAELKRFADQQDRYNRINNPVYGKSAAYLDQKAKQVKSSSQNM